MAMPTSVTVEVEFVAGTWTDVTAYLDGPAGGSTRFGRTSPYGASSPGTVTLTLANDDGRFTAGRQVLADGVTPHPYWPNVVPRKRIRLGWIVAGLTYYRFIGYIKGWPPSMINGDTARVTISASTRDDRLSRVYLLPSLQVEMAAQAPMLWWQLGEPAGAAAALEVSGATSLRPFGTGPAPSFGSTGLDSGDGTAVTFAPTGAGTGQRLAATWVNPTQPRLSRWSISVWVNAGMVAPSWASVDGQGILALGMSDPTLSSDVALALDTLGRPIVIGTGAGALTGPTSIIDGEWHLLTFTSNSLDGIFPQSLYVDGVLVVQVGSGPGFLVQSVYLGDIVDLSLSIFGAPTSRFQGSLAQLSVIGRELSAAEVALQYNGGTGWAGETVSSRIARFLTYAGVVPAEQHIDASTVVLSGYQQGGKDIMTACQDAVASEGGGAACYFGTDGKAQFRSRNFRRPTTALTVTLDAEADLDGGSYQPIYDDTLIVNQVQGSRATATQTPSTQTANDVASQTAYGLSSGQPFTSYATTDADVLANAQDQVARQRNPNFQIPQVVVDLSTATTANVYANVDAAETGDRIRLVNLPPGAAPTTQVDLFVEGWADTFSSDSYAVTFDCSPANTPPWAIWNDTTYGRWQCDGGQTLSAGITAAATSLAIATAAGSPVFTTDPTMYPLTILVGAEQITLPAAPGGATSPQSFTGVTRGVNGTTAAAQAGGALVDLAPASTWTL